MPAGIEPAPKTFVAPFGSVDATWKLDVAPDDVLPVAVACLQHRVALRLAGRGIRAKQLAEQLGGSEQAWRNKLSGTRRLRWDDIIAIAMVVDPGLPDALPTSQSVLTDYLPSAYRALLVEPTLGATMPRFRVQIEQPDWVGVASDIDTWWNQQERAAHTWSMTEDVFRHELLGVLDVHGLPGNVATLASTADPTVVEWVSNSLRLKIAWLDPSATHPDASALRLQLRRIAAALWLREPSDARTNVMAIAAPTMTHRTFDDLVGFDGSAANEQWTTWSLAEAARLGLSEADTNLDDLHVRSLVLRQPASRLRWIETKVGAGVE